MTSWLSYLPKFTGIAAPSPTTPSPPPDKVVEEGSVPYTDPKKLPLANTVIGDASVYTRARSSPWIQRFTVIMGFVFAFTLLLAFKLDMNLPGSWWGVAVPLFICQGFFAILVLLYVLRIKISFTDHLRLDVPNEATVMAEFFELLIILGLFAIEATVIVKLEGNDNYSWGVAFIPAYVIGAVALAYYVIAYLQPKWFVDTAHYNRHVISKADSLTRGGVSILFLLFISFLALDLDDVIDIWIGIILLPPILACAIVLRWMYSYSMGSETRRITGLQIVTVVAFITVVVLGVLFLILKIDETIGWSWFAVLTPIASAEIILWLVFCAWIGMAKFVVPHKTISIMQKEKEETGQVKQVDIYESVLDDENDLEDM